MTEFAKFKFCETNFRPSSSRNHLVFFENSLEATQLALLLLLRLTRQGHGHFLIVRVAVGLRLLPRAT